MKNIYAWTCNGCAVTFCILYGVVDYHHWDHSVSELETLLTPFFFIGFLSILNIVYFFYCYYKKRTKLYLFSAFMSAIYLYALCNMIIAHAGTSA